MRHHARPELLLISETMLSTSSRFGSAPEILTRHVVHARVSLFKHCLINIAGVRGHLGIVSFTCHTFSILSGHVAGTSFCFHLSLGCTLLFYETYGKNSTEQNSAPRCALFAEDSIVQSVPEHPKKEHVFCLSNSCGDVYLFQVPLLFCQWRGEVMVCEWLR